MVGISPLSLYVPKRSQIPRGRMRAPTQGTLHGLKIKTAHEHAEAAQTAGNAFSASGTQR